MRLATIRVIDQFKTPRELTSSPDNFLLDVDKSGRITSVSMGKPHWSVVLFGEYYQPDMTYGEALDELNAALAGKTEEA